MFVAPPVCPYYFEERLHSSLLVVGPYMCHQALMKDPVSFSEEGGGAASDAAAGRRASCMAGVPICWCRSWLSAVLEVPFEPRTGSCAGHLAPETTALGAR